jgi:phospholipase C
MTWNVWMMPRWTFQSPSNSLRASALATEILKLDVDIVCLQKVFDRKALRVLERSLRERYPYQYGPVNGGPSLRLSGGVWVASRVQLSEVRQLQYRDCRGIECLSRKGALLLNGQLDSLRFVIASTHLQGESGPNWTAKNQAIRQSQIEQLARALVPLADEADLAVVAGDFVTPRRIAEGAPAESQGYRELVETLGVTNGVEDRVTLEDDREFNDLAQHDTGRRDELDYVFIRTKSALPEAQWYRLVLENPTWDKKRVRRDLSYRYPVVAVVRLGSHPRE